MTLLTFHRFTHFLPNIVAVLWVAIVVVVVVVVVVAIALAVAFVAVPDVW